MRKFTTKIIFIHCCIFFAMYNTAFAVGEPTMTIEETRALLQKGLNIFEIDQEISRLTEKEEQLELDIILLEENIEQKDKIVEQTKERTGKVLRAYYMGERDSLITMLLTSESLSDALAVIEFATLVFQSDQRIINNYLASYQELKAAHVDLLAVQTDIQQIKAQFLTQKKTLIAMQDELDAALADHPDAGHLEKQIELLTQDWAEKGLPVFRSYLRALAGALQDLPEIQAQHKDVVSFKGTNILFQITDEQLNEFLKSKITDMENFQFKFEEEKIIASGQHQDMEASIQGHYSLVSEPKNMIRFYIDELIYNGFYLPESTGNALEEQFDLGFYPEKFSFFGIKLEATGVQVESGKLKVTLKLK